VATSPLRIATGIAGLAAGIVAPRVGEGIMDLGDVATEAFMAPYGRSQEREADDVGVDLAARAGYNPTGLPRALQALERDEALHRDAPPRQSFFDTHPATPERVRETLDRAAALRQQTAAPIAKTHRDFLGRLDGLIIGEDPADGTFVDSRFFHPTLGFTLRFPAKWQTRNTPRAAVAHTQDKEAAFSSAWPERATIPSGSPATPRKSGRPTAGAGHGAGDQRPAGGAKRGRRPGLAQPDDP